SRGGSPGGSCVAALTVTAAGTAVGRWPQRPGAIVRLPGTIMLVPGSASLRGLLTTIQQQDAMVGQSALIDVLNIVMAIIAGMLFGNLLLPARKNL
ncbi:MAG: threonine/serine exporter family protein, partial [Xanthomonadaceae bacterium]|nr:threonine/serine exporter family protein [Xanthomonadaceae bacterium]